MSDKATGADNISVRDQEALAATQGMGLAGLGQPKQTAAPAPVTTPADGENIKPAPQPGTGIVPAAGAQPPAGGEQPQAGGEQPQAGTKPIEVQSPLGAQVFGAPGDPVLTSFADVQAYAKENGIDMESPDSIRTLIGTVTDLQKKAQEAQDLQIMVNQYKNQFGNLPPEVANIVERAVKGEDYKSTIKDIAAGVTLDLSRNYSDHSPINLIRKYAQPDITQEAYDELTEPNKAALNALAKTSYAADQVRYNAAIADQSGKKQKFDQDYAKSVQTALDKVKQEFPNMNDAALKVVKDRMEFGLVDSLFNQDNTYKPDAGVKIAMQEFGHESLKNSYATIGELAGKIESRIQSTTYENLVKRSDAPDQQGRQIADNSNVIADAVKAQTSFTKTRF